MAKGGTIRALERGLHVIDALHTTPIASLHDIHLTTGISKPSLLRILSTLEHAGVVSRRLGDGRYRISVLSGMGRKGDRYDRVAEAAAPVLQRLCRKVRWPSDLAVPAGDSMERRETSRMHSPFLVQPMQRTRHQARIGWLLTGMGRAYLAFCPDKEREAILQRLRNSDKPEDRLARDPKRLERILAEVRQRGYATRDPTFVGGQYGAPPFDDGLAAIVVPLQDGPRVHGAINMLWIKSAFTVEAFAAQHLADLRGAAAEIVDSVRKSTGRRARNA